jgi:hypothetical protein
VVEPREQVHPDLEYTRMHVAEVRVSAYATEPRGGKAKEPGVSRGLEPKCPRTSSPTACALSQKAKSSLICTDQSNPAPIPRTLYSQ